jgi:hypothetical protein
MTTWGDLDIADPADLVVVRRGKNGRKIDEATALEVFGKRLNRLVISDSQGSTRGATRCWSVKIAGEVVGELRGNAGRMKIHIAEDDGAGDQIIEAMAEGLFTNWRTQSGEQPDASYSLRIFLNSLSIEQFCQEFTKRGGLLGSEQYI